MHFENRQDEKKRRIKEGHLKKSKCGTLWQLHTATHNLAQRLTSACVSSCIPEACDGAELSRRSCQAAQLHFSGASRLARHLCG